MCGCMYRYVKSTLWMHLDACDHLFLINQRGPMAGSPVTVLYGVVVDFSDKVEVILPEYAVPFLIHLLAHHPDLQEQTQDCLAQLKE